MQKQSNIDKKAWGEALAAFLGVGQEAAQAIIVLGSAVTAGLAGFGGWAASEITAKGQNDVNNVRKEYMDARLSADIAEQEQKLKNEFNARNNTVQNKQINLFR